MIDILEIIRQMQKEKEYRHIEPSHVMYIDLQHRVNETLNEELNELYHKGLIEVNTTLNDKAIKIKAK
jgi:DNA-binding transcriptional regulator GbsR (MarR family)